MAKMSGMPHTQSLATPTAFEKAVSQPLVASTDATTPGADCAVPGSDATDCSAVGAVCAYDETNPPQSTAADVRNREMSAFMAK
jgi:hypothetical protein